jgi:glycosyltransferase involved in cell wall biosynthesis
MIVAYAGPDELVTPACGYRIPLGDRSQVIAAIRSTLEAIVADPSALAPMSEKARTRVETLFTWDAKAAQSKAIYEWVLGRRGKPDFGMPLREV